MEEMLGSEEGWFSQIYTQRKTSHTHTQSANEHSYKHLYTSYQSSLMNSVIREGLASQSQGGDWAQGGGVSRGRIWLV